MKGYKKEINILKLKLKEKKEKSKEKSSNIDVLSKKIYTMN